MMNERPRYHAYLLRLYQVRDDKGMIWRASLESPHTGKRHGFANLDALLDFLAADTSSPGQPEEKSDYMDAPKVGRMNESDDGEQATTGSYTGTD